VQVLAFCVNQALDDIATSLTSICWCGSVEPK